MLCVCDSLKKISCKTQVVVLQHPQEKREELATLGMLKSAIPNLILKIGLSWPNLKKIIGHEVNLSRWAVIYLGTQAESQKLLHTKEPLILVGKTSDARTLEGIVVLDGSWREAKALWWRNAWLLKLNRIVLNPPQASPYSAVRREPRRESVSTLEAVAMALAEIESEPRIKDELLGALHKMLEKAKARGIRSPSKRHGGPYRKGSTRAAKRRPRGSH